VITEIMQNPSAVLDNNGEYFEVHNPTAAAIDMLNFIVKDNGANSFTVTTSVIVPAGGYAVFAINGDPLTNGGITVDYDYPSGFVLSNGDDEVILECGGVVIDSVYYDGGPSYPDPTGASMSLDPTTLDAMSNDDGANWCESTTPYGAGDLGTPGAANDVCAAPSCEINAFFISNDGCVGSDYVYDVNFTPTLGSGNYEVYDVTNMMVIATGTASPITITIVGNTSTTPFDIVVRDAADITCVTSNMQTITPIDCSIMVVCPNAGDLVITEIMQNPTAVGDTDGEYFEVFNSTLAAIDMFGFDIRDDDSDDFVVTTSLVVPAGGYAVFGRNGDPLVNGGYTADYVYTGFAMSSSDEVVLECNGVIIDSVDYNSGLGFPTASGLSMNLNPMTLDAMSNDMGSNWCESTTPFGAGDLGTPEAANDVCAPPPCSITGVSVSNAGCVGADYVFEVNFTAMNGSGNYDVIDVTNGNAVLASGTTSPITVTIVGNTSTTAFDVDVWDNADNTCVSGTPAAVTPDDCTPAGTCDPTLTLSGTLMDPLYEASMLIEILDMGMTDIGADVTLDAPTVILNPEFTTGAAQFEFIILQTGCTPVIFSPSGLEVKEEIQDTQIESNNGEK